MPSGNPFVAFSGTIADGQTPQSTAMAPPKLSGLPPPGLPQRGFPFPGLQPPGFPPSGSGFPSFLSEFVFLPQPASPHAQLDLQHQQSPHTALGQFQIKRFRSSVDSHCYPSYPPQEESDNPPLSISSIVDEIVPFNIKDLSKWTTFDSRKGPHPAVIGGSSRATQAVSADPQYLRSTYLLGPTFFQRRTWLSEESGPCATNFPHRINVKPNDRTPYLANQLLLVLLLPFPHIVNRCSMTYNSLAHSLQSLTLSEG